MLGYNNRVTMHCQVAQLGSPLPGIVDRQETDGRGPIYEIPQVHIPPQPQLRNTIKDDQT